MPKVDPNILLFEAIEMVVEQAGGNESEAARRLGTTRLRINRIRKARGGATPAVRNELWKLVESLDGNDGGSIRSDTSDTKAIHPIRDVPGIALQVLRYMTTVLERDLGTEGQSNAH